MIPSKSIDEVLLELDRIIENSVQENNYLGIFAYIYRRTTAQIKEEIAKQTFDDNERMERFDTTFANFYLTAYQNYFQDLPVSASWKIAFDARNENLTIIQHLLMGMNAHINLDLGVAAARIMEGQSFPDLKTDFMKVNDILAGLVNEMQIKIGRVSPLIFLLDWIGGRTDEKIIDFSMVKARRYSWNTATALSKLDEADQQQKINQVDQFVAELSELIRNPDSLILKFSIRFIRLFEERNLKRMIEKLEEPVKS